MITKEKLPIEEVSYGVGCDQCRQTGYSGRLGVYGLLIPNDNVLSMISDNKSLQELKKEALQSHSLTTLNHDAIRKIDSKQTTVQAVLRVTQ